MGFDQKTFLGLAQGKPSQEIKDCRPLLILSHINFSSNACNGHIISPVPVQILYKCNVDNTSVVFPYVCEVSTSCFAPGTGSFLVMSRPELGS